MSKKHFITELHSQYFFKAFIVHSWRSSYNVFLMTINTSGTFLSIPTQHCIPLPFFLTHRAHLILSIYSWMCNCPVEHGPLTRGHTLKENWLFLSYHPFIVNNYLAGAGTFCLSPFSILGVLSLFLVTL